MLIHMKPKLKSLSIDGVPPMPCDILQCIENSKVSLKHFSMQSVELQKIDPKFLKFLADCTNLLHLDLAGAKGLAEDSINLMIGSSS